MTRTILKEYPTLWKQDKSNKNRFWKLYCVKEDDKMAIETVYGQEKGKPINSSKEVKEGKNIGKKNETSKEEQMILICNKLFKDKIEKEKYTEKVSNITDKETDRTYSPMLADKWDPNNKVKRKIDIVFPCFVQPKLDGIRCLSYIRDGKVVNQSRQLKYFNSLNHINEELLDLLKSNKGLVLDGELYNHDIIFNKLAGLVKTEKIQEEDKDKYKLIQYHIYDCFFENDTTLTYSQRKFFLDKTMNNTFKYVKIVPTYTCEHKDNINNYHIDFTNKNYEGIILRNMYSTYEFRRTRNLQKYKTFEEDEFQIIDFKEGNGHDSGTVIWKCKTKDGNEFDVRPVGSVEDRKIFFKNAPKYIDNFLTVKFQGYSEFGIPRFPVGKSIRNYE